MARSTLKVKQRIRLGKTGSKQVRKEGKIPAVIYGKGMESIPLIIDPAELKGSLATDAGKNTLLDLEIETEGEKISKLGVLKDIQLDYITQKPIHLDFQVINTKDKIAVDVPLNLTGRAQGIKEGGILEQNIREINVECLPENIPSIIEFDISEMELGDALHLRDITLPEGVESLINADSLVASIQTPRAMVTDMSSATTEEEEEQESEDAPVEEKEEEKTE